MKAPKKLTQFLPARNPVPQAGTALVSALKQGVEQEDSRARVRSCLVNEARAYAPVPDQFAAQEKQSKLPIPKDTDAVSFFLSLSVVESTRKGYMQKTECYKRFCRDEALPMDNLQSFALFLFWRHMLDPFVTVGNDYRCALKYAATLMPHLADGSPNPEALQGNNSWLYSTSCAGVIKGEERLGGMRDPKRPRGTLTVEQAKQWLRHVSATEGDHMAAAMAVLFFGQLRISELFALSVNCIVMMDGRSHLEIPLDKPRFLRKEHSDGVQRKLIVCDELAPIVALLRGGRNEGTLVSPEAVDVQHMRSIMRKIPSVLGLVTVADFTPHAFRRAGIMHIYGMGLDEKTVEAATGKTFDENGVYVLSAGTREAKFAAETAAVAKNWALRGQREQHLVAQNPAYPVAKARRLEVSPRVGSTEKFVPLLPAQAVTIQASWEALAMWKKTRGMSSE